MTKADEIKNQLAAIIQVYGPEQTKAAAAELLGPVVKSLKIPVEIDATQLDKALDKFAKLQAIPAEYIPVLSPQQLVQTVDQLEAAVSAVIEKGEAKENAYKDKPYLLARKAELETAIKLTEAEAIMAIKGEGKQAHVVINGEITYLTNETARDAYRHMASKALREELAQVEGQLQALEIEVIQAADAWYAAKEASDSIRAKANLQAALLNFLARG